MTVMRKAKQMEEQEQLALSLNKKLVYVPDSGLEDGDYPIDISFRDAKRFWLVIR